MEFSRHVRKKVEERNDENVNNSKMKLLKIHRLSSDSGGQIVGVCIGGETASVRAGRRFATNSFHYQHDSPQCLQDSACTSRHLRVVHVLGLPMDWVGSGRKFSVFGGLGWVHYIKSTKNLKGLCECIYNHG